jgi:glycosyltransferase involved in cell wall biosynthesis
MNLLVVDQFGEMGGAQKCLIDLLDGWQDSGTIIAAVPDGNLARSLAYQTTTISCGPYGFGEKTGGDAFRFCSDTASQLATLRRIIERNAIDVVYVNGPRVLAGATLAARGRCPVVFHAHNYLANWYDRAIVRVALNHGVTAIACCEHVATSLDDRALVIHNGVPDAGFQLRQYPPAGPWRIGIVGRIAPEKGHLELLRAVGLLIAEGHRIELVVAGASRFAPAAYEDRVTLNAAGLPVQFTGWSDDVGSLLVGLDLLAVPSISEPGLPRVVLEAFSAGLPVLAAPTGGIAEAVHDNETGFLAHDSTTAALAGRLRSVLLAPGGELTRVTLRARAEWLRHWNVTRWRQEVLSVIHSAQRPQDALQQRRQQRGRVMPKA